MTSRLTRRQRRRVWQGVQYAVFVAALVLIGVTADWGRLQNQFAQTDLAVRLFPDIITIALRNTVVYTFSGFLFGLALGLVIAMMRLSSVAPYRWVASVYIELFRGLPALLIFIFVGVAVPLAFPGTEIPGGIYGKVALGLGLVAAAYMAETIRALHPGRAQGADGSRPVAGLLARPGHGLGDHPAGVPHRHPAAHQRTRPAVQGLLAGAVPGRDAGAAGTDEIRPRPRQRDRQLHPDPGRGPVLPPRDRAAELRGAPA